MAAAPRISFADRRPLTRVELCGQIATLRACREALEEQAARTGHPFASVTPIERELARLEVDLADMDDDSARVVMRMER